MKRRLRIWDVMDALGVGGSAIPAYLLAVWVRGDGPQLDDLAAGLMVGPIIVLVSVWAGRERWLMLRARRPA